MIPETLKTMQNDPHKRKSSLPSPPSSGPVRETNLGTSPSDGRSTPDGQSKPQHLTTFDQSELWSGRKRRRTPEEDDSEEPHEPCRKRNKDESERSPQQDLKSRSGDAEEQDPIQFWAKTGNWPQDFSEMSELESDASTKRRRSSTPSYSSRAREGSVPAAHTAAYEEELRRYGIRFEVIAANDLVTAESKDMCQALLGLKELAPAYNSCSKETYTRLFERASKCSEERVRRDLTPHIVPSAELLYIIDRETALENVREEMSVDWTKCNLLGGTRPRPDYAYGLSSATFTEEERAKLENYTNINNPTKFTESMYFPFLLCEAKCGKKNINDADRQNVHSASIAVNAIVQLCRAAGQNSAQSLSGQILVFSISHDNERVKIYGHFPLFRDGSITFHRYYVHDYSLDGHLCRDRDTGSNFTRAVYSNFYPEHLKRIQQAIARLPDPRTTSVVSQVNVGEGETQSSEQSSHERDSSPRPPLRRAKSQGSQGELTLMKQQMAKIEQMYKAQLEQQKEESQKQMEQQQKLMEQQREESQRQMALLERLLNREQSR